jgi:pimeloyl-ACP methyl ester carboxylesterase
MPKIPLNGTTIHLTTLGEGPDLILVHGMAANLAFWFPRLAPALARDHRVILFDLRGHGLSDMPPSGYTPGDHAADLGAVMDHLGIEKADVVGHSFGGTVALEYAARNPERVRTLTIADGMVACLQAADSGHDWAYWQSWRAELQKVGIEVPADLPRVTFAMLEELADPARLPARRQARTGGEFFVPFGRWNGARRTAERWLLLLRTTSAWRELQSEGLALEEIRRLQQPILLAYGERSRWLKTCGLLGEALPHSETVIIKGAGHFFPLLKPLVFLGHLRSFLERHRPPTRRPMGREVAT